MSREISLIINYDGFSKKELRKEGWLQSCGFATIGILKALHLKRENASTAGPSSERGAR